MAVYARSLIPPALKHLGAYIYGKQVFVFLALAELDKIGYINLKAVISAKIMLQNTAVQIHCAVSCNSLEKKRESFALVGLNAFLYHAFPYSKNPRALLFSSFGVCFII